MFATLKQYKDSSESEKNHLQVSGLSIDTIHMLYPYSPSKLSWFDQDTIQQCGSLLLAIFLTLNSVKLPIGSNFAHTPSKGHQGSLLLIITTYNEGKFILNLKDTLETDNRK